MSGLGIDIVEISRFEKVNEDEAFSRRVFTENERKYFMAKKNYAESAAGFFAAKEAFSKCLGTGVRSFSLCDVEVLHDSLGAPYIMFFGIKAPVKLSISHSRTHAAAVCAASGEDKIILRAAMNKSRPREILPKRKADAHKGDFGKLLIVAGSRGMTGAACLSALSAMRSGAGTVTAALPQSQQPIAAAKLTEAMTLALSEDDCGRLSALAAEEIARRAETADAVVFGPGLGRGGGIRRILESLLEIKTPVLIDADGINALSLNIDIMSRKNCGAVLTPHVGEMSRLSGLSTAKISENREAAAQEIAEKLNSVVVLKGVGTVIAAPCGNVEINPTGNPGMATGGSGDVLSGIIGAFMAQGLDLFAASVRGVYVHGLAGDMAAEKYGQPGMIAGDIIEFLPQILK